MVHCDSLRNVPGATYAAISKAYSLSQLFLAGCDWEMKLNREAREYDEACKVLQTRRSVAKGDQACTLTELYPCLHSCMLLQVFFMLDPSDGHLESRCTVVAYHEADRIASLKTSTGRADQAIVRVRMDLAS